MTKFACRCVIIGFIFITGNGFAQGKIFNDSIRSIKRTTYGDTLLAAKEKSLLPALQSRYETARKELIYIKRNAAEQVRTLKRQQFKLAQQYKKRIEKIRSIAYHHNLENARKLQAALLQKNTLQARFDKQVSDQQIFSQNEKLKNDSRSQTFLIILLVAALTITSLFFYNQLKMRQLNQVITTQKQELENINSVKDRMFSVISHDMRAPVNTLMAFNTLLDDDELTTNKIKLYAKEIKKALNNTAILLENLLNWSSSQMQGCKPVLETNLLKAIVTEAINTIAERADQKHITIKNNITETAVVYADKNMTELVIRNILANAIKYTSKGGAVEINSIQNQNTTTFSITDTGTGMDAMMVSRFNEAASHEQIKPKPGTDQEKGAGLGLMLCKTFTGIMNGKITLNSKYGAGSTFSITLPANS